MINFNPNLSNHFLFDNCSHLSFLEIPRNDCFFQYKRIFNYCRGLYKTNTIFVFSAGPTATCLAYDICRDGEQGIDIGALVFEYQIFKGDLDPTRYTYQNLYRKGKRGYLRGINEPSE